MTLAQLLDGFPCADPIPTRDILSLTESSAQANSSALFVCIEGARADGHNFAQEAYKNGCRTFVAQKKLSLPHDAFVLSVSNTRYALAILACRLYGEPSRQMRLIGITGTKGKTTTAQLISHLLNRSGISCGYIGTNGISYGNISMPSRNTTPDAVTLQQTLSDMLCAGVKAAVIEVSSQALMQYRADGIGFEGVIFTNLSPDHIGQNEHPDFASYRACKKRLFTDFGAKYAIANIDDPASREMLCGTAIPHIISCSVRQSNADLYASHLRLLRNDTALGISFSVSDHRMTCDCTLPLTGKVNAENALLAIATAIHIFGIPMRDAVTLLADATVTGRSEFLPLPNGACAVIDYAHNEASLRQLLVTLREYQPARLIALFGSIGGRAQMRRQEMGKAAAELCDLCILTSDNPANETPEQIIEDIAAAFQGYDTPYIKIADRAEAIRAAVELTCKGDILVLAGKGHETYQLIGNQKIAFSERAIITEALRSVKI